jgi:flagellar hook-basal body complex protein FliE
MTINSIQPAGSFPVSEMLSQPSVPAGGGAFGGLIERLLENAGSQQLQANQAVRDLALGKSDSLHNVMLEVAKADLAFRLVLEIRNRLTDAYQQIMQMQV